jgi:hypothetical protein
VGVDFIKKADHWAGTLIYQISARGEASGERIN